MLEFPCSWRASRRRISAAFNSCRVRPSPEIFAPVKLTVRECRRQVDMAVVKENIELNKGLKNGYFEVPLPAKLFEGNPDQVTLRWIDFYRR